MNNFEEQLREIGKQITLKEDRKKAIGASLMRFMEGKEVVRVWQDARHIYQSNPIVNPSLLTFFTKPMSILLMIALIVGVGGGTSFAAENSLPGDVLYPVKVDFNEKVGAVFSFSAEAKARLEAELAARRLEEASRLAAENKLNAETRAELAARFEAHAENMERRVHNLETSGDARGAANVTSDFEASLRSRQAILARLNATTSSIEIGPLEVKVSGRLRNAIKLRADLEGRVTAESNSPEVRTAAEGRLRAATNVIASARSYVQNQKSRVSAEALARAEVELKAADRLVIDGQAKVKAEAYGEAFNLANAAIRKAHQAKMIITATRNLNLEIRINEEGNGSGSVNSGASAILEERGGSDSGSVGGGTKLEKDVKTEVNLPGVRGDVDASNDVEVRTGL